MKAPTELELMGLAHTIADNLRVPAGTNLKPLTRLLTLLAHAVAEADGWHDECRGSPIEGDALMDEARALLSVSQLTHGAGSE